MDRKQDMLLRSLLLPAETLNRDFDAKLLLALHAAERGWQTFVGKRSTLHDQVWRFPRSVYFSKDFRGVNEPMFRIMRHLGHAIVGLDEEALVNASDDMLLMKLDPVSLEYLEFAFAWGEHDARLYPMASRGRDLPVAITGNPRFDLLRPELSGYFADDARGIRSRFGRFALLNTNFSMVNHFIANETRFRLAKWVPSSQATELRAGMVAHKSRLFQAFLELVPRLAHALAPHALVIRPHPSESHQTWADAAAGLKNVHVVHEGSVVPWLQAADALIHNGCTSAVEAAVVETPAYSYRPVANPDFDNALPNGLSLEFETPGALVESMLQQFRVSPADRRPLAPDRQALLERHVAALDGPLACARIIDEIERRLDAAEPADPPGWQSLAAGLSRLSARRIRRRVRKRSARAKGNDFYLRHKFPGIELSEVNARIARFRDTLGRFEGVTARQVVSDLFRVSRA